MHEETKPARRSPEARGGVPVAPAPSAV